MKRTSHLWTVAIVMVLLAGVAGAQSLADVARKTRKQNAKKPAAKVYTNDDLPSNAPISVAGQPPADSAQAGSAASSSDGKDQKAAQAAAGQQNDDQKKTAAEKRDQAIQQWKQRFAEQKNKINLLQREIDVMQGEYRLRAAAYYADAGNALRNQADWAKQDREYREKLDAKQKQLNEAKQKLDDMQEDARKADMPSSVAD